MTKRAFTLAVLAFAAFSRSPNAVAVAEGFVEKYPALKEYLFEEPVSRFRIGFGVGPFGIVRNQLNMSASLFQLHWKGSWLDWELFNAGIGFSMSTEDAPQSRQISMRTAPKFRVTRALSVGPLAGYELVTFPGIDSRITSNGFATPVEPFSTRGAIYGLEVSETFTLGKGIDLQLSQVAYRQTYSSEDAGNGWNYRFPDSDVARDVASLKGGNVFQMEISVLY